MAKRKPDPIQDKKDVANGMTNNHPCCPSCRFYLWFKDYNGYACSIKGCIGYSKYIEFKGQYSDERGWL